MADSLGWPLTKRQRKVFRFIARKVATRGYPPSNDEVRDAFGFRSKNAFPVYMRAFRKKGYLTSQPFTARGISLTDLGRAYAAECGYNVGGAGPVWGLIDTAPRDGTEVCVAGRDKKDGWYCWPDHWSEDTDSGEPGWLMAADFGIEPTHWIPFPEVAPTDAET